MTIRVVHGANEDHFEVAGSTVEYIATQLRVVFNISPDAEAILNGITVPFETVLSDGDQLEFVQENGRKGGLQDFWSEPELLRFFGPKYFELMKQNGFTLKPQLVATADDVIVWQQWLMDRSIDPAKAIPVQVDIASETITVSGVHYEIDKQLAAVVQCLLNARGESRSTTQMKLEYPKDIFDDRLDMTIGRKLKPHKSGVGQFIKSDKRGYRLVYQESE